MVCAGRLLVTLLLVSILGPAVSNADPGYLALEKIADDLGLSYDWVEPDRSVRLSGSSIQLDFTTASRVSSLNGIKVYLGKPALSNSGKLYIASLDWKDSIQPILMPRVFPNPPGFQRVVIDAGHGGRDPGGQNLRLGIDEKDLALDVSRLVGKRLRAAGFDVAFTRTDDHFVELDERPLMANRAGADIFLSIHFNAARESVRGVETFVYTLPGTPSSSRTTLKDVDRKTYPGNVNDPWNALLGYYVQSELVRATGLPDRGLKRARFAVLETVRSPAALLELGFITNQQTALRLREAGYRERLAESVARAVVRYRTTLMRLHQRD